MQDLIKDLNDRIMSVPVHSGYSISGLHDAIDYLEHIKNDLIMYHNNNQINDEQYEQIMSMLNRDLNALSFRLNSMNKYSKANDMMKSLGITSYDHYVRAIDLYDIFSNEEKMQDLIKKIKMRNFW